MKTFLALVGGFILALAVLSMFGVGSFVLMYGPDNISCVKEVKQ
jgi:hypothetical protein